MTAETMILQQQQATQNVIIQRHSELLLAPQISLAVFTWGLSAPNQRNTGRLIQPVLKLKQEAITSALHTEALPDILRTQAEEVVDHIVVHRTRIEVVPEMLAQPAGLSSIKSTDTGGQQLPKTTSPIYPVMNIVRPSPARGSDLVEEHVLMDRGKATEKITSGTTLNVPQMHEESPTNVNRLTDQIMQLIDHRIIAHRERLGRL